MEEESKKLIKQTLSDIKTFSEIARHDINDENMLQALVTVLKISVNKLDRLTNEKSN